ncbi:hypothetical protein FRUB_00568 [Fimbriiglobus ruber]|uniref:Uncharacterized protein n=1 Tax=Fimbriiglobus ruber TaxID=1908690 RepID=A0A225EC08_9BACT|nr:hypothetical protein FRUB_00568 [Fimbriiglobus ruber]
MLSNTSRPIGSQMSKAQRIRLIITELHKFQRFVTVQPFVLGHRSPPIK